MTEISADQGTDRDLKPQAFSRLPQWLLLFGFWSLVGLMIATLSHSRMVAVERPSVYMKWLLESLLIWNFWAVLSPLIFKLGGRVYANRSRRVSGIALLVVTAVVVAVTFICYQVAISMKVMGESFDRYSSTIVGQLAWFGPYALLIFGGLVSLGYARAYRRRWEENERAVRALESQLAQAQLDVLKAQLQPHFFFNTLNSISVLIRKGDTDSAQAMLTRLGELLRYTLAIGKRQTVPLAHEIEFVKGYLEIEKARFGERLNFSLSIAPDTSTLQIPPLLIQPIVENAVRHGISDRATGGSVSIQTKRENDLLTISVVDDGIGFEQQSGKHEGEGLGIGHTKARLEQLYGERSTLEIASNSSGGTTVTMRIPVGSNQAER